MRKKINFNIQDLQASLSLFVLKRIETKRKHGKISANNVKILRELGIFPMSHKNLLI